MTHNKTLKPKVPNYAKNSDFIVSPVTGRLIKIHSRAYNQLLKDKVLDITSDRSKNVIYDGPHAVAVKSSLKHAENVYLHQKGDQILQYRRKLPSSELMDHIMRASHVIKDNADKFTDDMSDTDIRNLARHLLAQHLVL